MASTAVVRSESHPRGAFGGILARPRSWLLDRIASVLYKQIRHETGIKNMFYSAPLLFANKRGAARAQSVQRAAGGGQWAVGHAGRQRHAGMAGRGVHLGRVVVRHSQLAERIAQP